MILYQRDNSSVRYNLNTVIYDDFEYVTHIHRDFEVVYVYRGSVFATVENQRFEIKEGEYALVLQNQIHQYESPFGSKTAVTVFASDYVRDFAAAVAGKSYEMKSFVMPDTKTEIIDSVLFSGKGDRYETIACLNLIVSAFLSNVKECDVAFKDSDLLHLILSYVSEHYTENITLGDVARSLGYEEHYLSRFFHRYIDKNFKKLVNEHRVYHATNLIRSGERNITKIAYESGFQSVRNFNRAYKSIVGCIPTEYDKI